jgi:hypothetical protein
MEEDRETAFPASDITGLGDDIVNQDIQTSAEGGFISSGDYLIQPTDLESYETDDPDAVNVQAANRKGGDSNTDDPGAGDTETFSSKSADLKDENSEDVSLEADKSEVDNFKGADDSEAANQEADNSGAADLEAAYSGDSDSEADNLAASRTRPGSPGEGSTWDVDVADMTLIEDEAELDNCTYEDELEAEKKTEEEEVYAASADFFSLEKSEHQALNMPADSSKRIHPKFVHQGGATGAAASTLQQWKLARRGQVVLLSLLVTYYSAIL